MELELYKRQQYLSWETFANRIKEMEASNLLIDCLRLDAMFTYIYGLRSDHRKQMLLTNYRHRDSTKWSELEKKDASNFFASVGTRQCFSKDQDADDVHDQLAMKAFSTIKTNEMYRKIKFCGVQSDTLDFIFSNKTDSSTRTSSNATTNHDQLLRGDVSNASTREIASNLKAAPLPQTSSSSVKCNLK